MGGAVAIIFQNPSAKLKVNPSAVTGPITTERTTLACFFLIKKERSWSNGRAMTTGAAYGHGAHTKSAIWSFPATPSEPNGPERSL